MSRPKTIKFSGIRLRMVHRALGDAIAEIHNQIATCPDVIEYESDIRALTIERAQYKALLKELETKCPELLEKS